MPNDPDWIHKEYPKTVPPEDFRRQTKRTVNGEPYPEEQMLMIVSAIEKRLRLKKQDNVLDLGCGNGELSSYLVDKVNSIHGVDFSEYLIDVAQIYFASDDLTFELRDILDCVQHGPTKNYTKCLCYGVWPFITAPGLVLQNLSQRFPKISKVFIGNIADRNRADAFFKEAYDRDVLNDRSSPLGVWYTQEQVKLLAEMAGWKAEISIMPKDYLAAHYRFDAVLTRP